MTELAKALVQAQHSMPGVDKTGKAVYGEYATIDEIIVKTRRHLNDHGLAITQFPEITELGAPALRTTITHVSGESVSSVMPLFLAKNDMQQLGSAITYARRYAWAAALGIAADHDDDGAAATQSDGGARVEPTPTTGSPPATTVAESPPSGTFTPPPAVTEELAAKQASSVPNQTSSSPEEMTLPFGKFSGRKLGDLVVGNAKEKGYVEWLAGEKFDAGTPEKRLLKGAAQTLLGQPLNVGAFAAGDDSAIPFAATWA